jgi:hypothetical protein
LGVTYNFDVLTESLSGKIVTQSAEKLVILPPKKPKADVADINNTTAETPKMIRHDLENILLFDFISASYKKST